MNVTEKKKEELHTSVRALVEFILRGGDIDNRRRVSAENAMQEGSRVHRLIQKRMGAGYRAEVPLRHRISFENYDIVLEGRADGIFSDKDVTTGEELTVIDEIKGVYRDLRKLNEPIPVHLAQAKCYGAILLIENAEKMLDDDSVINKIGIQLTYCNLDTEEIRRHRIIYERAELLEWFDELIREYEKWASFKYDWRRQRQESIHNLDFPFDYREGQKDLAASVYRTIYLKKRLFVEAPTGVGKTISTIFPAIKALGENKGEMIFYLTAKTLTATVASNTYNILRQQGLKLKTVAITAKDKICPMDESECNPDVCPYAKGHYDRINDAMFDLLNNRDDFSREIILEYANKHMVCPFEFCLDMSLFSDSVICDYNYVFDPNVYLRRFFADTSRGDYIFLVDEAHNLVDRAREMYSAVIHKDSFIQARKLVKPFDLRLAKSFDSCNKLMLDYMRESGEARIMDSIDPFLISLTRAAGYMDEFLEEDEGSSIRRELMDFYFEIRHFLNMAELLSDDYVKYSMLVENGDFYIKLLCVDPARNLRSCLDKGRATVFFSATLLPVTYYMDLLTGDRGDYAVYAKSSFDTHKRGVFLARDVSSKYTRRGLSEYTKIADYIYRITTAKSGKYMVFFPSYRFMEEVYDIFAAKYGDCGEISEILLQKPAMTEDEREEFLQRFDNENEGELFQGIISQADIRFDIEAEQEKTLVGFCVMGGIFSEGIDLKKDSLIGAVIVGTGLPQVGPELEIIKDYFDKREVGTGFDFAYRFPGMNKVLQSAGRVIRTAEDVGVVVLLDDRFDMPAYKSLFPREWDHIRRVNLNRITDDINEFWTNQQKWDVE